MPVLTATNWMSCVEDAIRDLPEDLRLSVGFRAGCGQMLLSVAGEPGDSPLGPETQLRPIVVVPFRSIADGSLPLEDWTSHFDAWFCEHGPLHELRARPGILIASCTCGCLGFFDRTQTAGFKYQLQLILLEEMVQGRLIERSEDHSIERFTREDGSLILEHRKPSIIAESDSDLR